MKPHLPLLLASLSLLGACSKNDKPAPPVEENKTIELVSNTTLPGQLVIAQANFKPLVTDTTHLIVNGQRVSAFANDSNQVIFIMPVLPAGKVTVDYSSIGAPKQLPLTINAYTAITQADKAIASFTTNIDQVIKVLEKQLDNEAVNLGTGYITTLRYMQETITENQSSLSPADQLTLAYFLQNNQPDPAAFAVDTLNPLFYRVNQLDIDPGERLFKVAIGFKNSVIRTVTFLGIGTGLAMLPSPDLFTKLLAFGSFVTGTVYLVDAIAKVEEIGTLKGVAEQLTDFTARLGVEDKELKFYKDVAKTVSFRASYRPVIQTDQSSKIPVIADIFAAEKSVGKIHAGMLAAYDRITKWFKKLAPVFPAYTNPIKTSKTTISYPMAGSKLKLSNVSDTAVRITFTTADTTLSIKAASASLKADKAFTFDVVFTDPNLGVTVTQKIKALYQVKPIGTVVAGNNGYGSAANQFQTPEVLLIDAAGNFIILDKFNNRVQRWTPGATTGVTIAGGNGIGTDSNKLNSPYGMAMAPDGSLYILNADGHIKRWVPGAAYGTTVYKFEDLEKYGYISNMAISPAGQLYIVSDDKNQVVRFALGSKTGTIVAGGNGKGSAANQLSRPEGVTIDAAGNLYISDYDNNRVQKWAPGATSGTTVAGGNGKGAADNQVIGPVEVVLDAQSNLYIAEAGGNQVSVWKAGAASGTKIASTPYGNALGELWGAVSIKLDGKGSIYILESGNGRVTKWLLP
ncbi:NHL repeat-containing protein [Paraflavitalea pollutisoli]|uniref:NHL repeat-containing protein n=1 Tax=Paraflavitalea pollutisoli TaxID=3034143 RepID=UPI0023EBB759|nr:NHL repeat-containing protein [Paraflavitalea sp. H1-2-19X]